MLSLEAFQRTSFCLIICFKCACAFCYASRNVKRVHSASLLSERQLSLSDANRNESSVTPMFSGLAFFQCKVSTLTSCLRRGFLMLLPLHFTVLAFMQHSLGLAYHPFSIFLSPWPYLVGLQSCMDESRVSCVGAESALSNYSQFASMLVCEEDVAPVTHSLLFSFEKNYIITKDSSNLISKADEWSIPHPALSAPSVQERSGAERALNGISYFVKLATSENWIHAGQLQAKISPAR